MSILEIVVLDAARGFKGAFSLGDVLYFVDERISSKYAAVILARHFTKIKQGGRSLYNKNYQDYEY
jgi:hypothetical protein